MPLRYTDLSSLWDQGRQILLIEEQYFLNFILLHSKIKLTRKQADFEKTVRIIQENKEA